MTSYLQTNERSAIEKYFLLKTLFGESWNVEGSRALDLVRDALVDPSFTLIRSASPFFWLNVRRVIGERGGYDKATATRNIERLADVSDWLMASNDLCSGVELLHAAASQYLLMNPTEKLVAKFAQDECDPHPTNIDEFIDAFQSATKLIEQAVPTLFGDLSDAVKFFIPIKSESRHIHRSFTSADHGATIFLSISPDPLTIAEALVHEHAHIRLNVNTWSNGIVAGPDPAVLYSPWRSDPRPLHGLVHGAFVFTEVLEFLLAHRELGGDVDEKIRSVMNRLLIAHRQVNREKLTKAGLEAWEFLSAKIEKAGVFDQKAQMIGQKETVAALEWQRRNPTLEIAGFY